MKCERYAIWWVPRPGTGLARFGVEWTGWCADRGVAHARPEACDLPQPRPGVPGTARLRGLHATIGAAFRPAEGRSIWAIERALGELAARTAPIRLPQLSVEVAEGRVVLALSRPDEAVATLLSATAEAIRSLRVRPEFEALAGPPCAIAPATATARGPMRFQMPLTDRVAGAAALAADLAPVLASLLAYPRVMADIALAGDPGGGRPWRLLERFGLEGDGAGSAAPSPDGMGWRGPDLLAPSLK